MELNLTLDDLEAFTGRPTDDFDEDVFAEFLSQAGDLLELATRVTTLPATGIVARTARRGVLAMTEALLEGQQYRDSRFSPFRSETIGSYNYTLLSEKVQSGLPTGIGWFDLAVRELNTTAVVSYSSISAFDRPGDVLEIEGRPMLLGPADRRRAGINDDHDEGPYGRKIGQ